MRYFKLFLLILSIIFSSCVCFAENWKDASIGQNDVYIDIDSINYHNKNIK